MAPHGVKLGVLGAQVLLKNVKAVSDGILTLLCEAGSVDPDLSRQPNQRFGGP